MRRKSHPAKQVARHGRGVAFFEPTPSQHETYRRSLDAVHPMREGKSLARASREAGVSPSSVLKHASLAIERRGGRYVARRADRLPRELLFYDAKGRIKLLTRSSKTASDIGRYHNAVRKYLVEGNDSGLRDFEGKAIVVEGGRLPFITDRRTLNRLARAGELNFLEIYQTGDAL
jgi:hypothetical protein